MWCPGWDPGHQERQFVKNKKFGMKYGLQLIIDGAVAQ